MGPRVPPHGSSDIRQKKQIQPNNLLEAFIYVYRNQQGAESCSVLTHVVIHVSVAGRYTRATYAYNSSLLQHRSVSTFLWLEKQVL